MNGAQMMPQEAGGAKFSRASLSSPVIIPIVSQCISLHVPRISAPGCPTATHRAVNQKRHIYTKIWSRRKIQKSVIEFDVHGRWVSGVTSPGWLSEEDTAYECRTQAVINDFDNRAYHPASAYSVEPRPGATRAEFMVGSKLAYSAGKVDRGPEKLYEVVRDVIC